MSQVALLGAAALVGAIGIGARWAVAVPADPGHPDHYLPACVGSFVDSAGARSERHFRWNAEDFPLRVFVPTPTGFGLTAPEAAARRQAVLTGLRAWQEKAPDVIVLDVVGDRSEAQIAPTWIDHYASDIGGQCFYTVTADQQGQVTMRISTFELALRRSPKAPQPLVLYTPEELQRTATHEMGHALGLGHSGRRSDVMFPDFTPQGWRVSERDERTLRRLYALPNGAKAS